MGRPRLVEVHWWSCAARALTTLMLAAPSLGCGSSSATLASEGPPPSLDNFEALRRGDVIEVKVFREADLDGVFRVGVGGDIDFPLIGQVDVEGKRPEEVARDIQRRLAGDYLKDPQVTVLVREQNSRKVHVFGQVEKAGTFPFRSGMTVIEAITSAGGFAQLAAANGTRVTRVVEGVERVFKLPAGDIGEGKAPNFYLQPGDIVFVPEAVF